MSTSTGILQAMTIDTFCVGTKGTRFRVDEHKGSTYFWYISGGVVSKGEGSCAVEIDWGMTPGLHEIMVNEQNPGGCFSYPVKSYVYLKGSLFSTQYPMAACPEDSVTILAGGGAKYLWSDGSTDSTLRIRLIHDTILQVIISDTVCGHTTDTVPVKIFTLSKPVATFYMDAKDVYINQHVIFNYGGDANDHVNWLIQKSNTSSRNGSVLNAQFTDTGLAVIKLYSINSNGCIDSTFRTIEIKSEQLYFPTAFTPNGDGLNDSYKPGGMGMRAYHITIYSRWGQVVFDSSNSNESWDGTFNQQPVQEGVYTYYCEAVGSSDAKYSYSGAINLMR
jgi:gliding motility-associated-like protein